MQAGHVAAMGEVLHNVWPGHNNTSSHCRKGPASLWHTMLLKEEPEELHHDDG
jgi:hypothetical protein